MNEHRSIVPGCGAEGGSSTEYMMAVNILNAKDVHDHMSSIPLLSSHQSSVSFPCPCNDLFPFRFLSDAVYAHESLD